MEALSVRDYRNNLAASFERAKEGKRVLIRRKNALYALVKVDSDELIPTHDMRKRVNDLNSSIIRSWNEVKQMEAGDRPSRPAMDFINGL